MFIKRLEFLKNKLLNKKILLLAPGISLKKYKSCIDLYINENNPVVISANFCPEDYKTDFCFFTNIRRFESYMDNGNASDKCVITSNIIHSGYCADKVVNYYNLAIDSEGLFDNCMIMLLKLLENFDIKSISVAGFDGYSEDKYANYIDATFITNQSDFDYVYNNKVLKDKLQSLKLLNSKYLHK